MSAVESTIHPQAAGVCPVSQEMTLQSHKLEGAPPTQCRGRYTVQQLAVLKEAFHNVRAGRLGSAQAAQEVNQGIGMSAKTCRAG
jgi:hypothetical protein